MKTRGAPHLNLRDTSPPPGRLRCEHFVHIVNKRCRRDLRDSRSQCEQGVNNVHADVYVANSTERVGLAPCENDGEMRILTLNQS
jgi:hypothetical protein